MLLMYQRFRNWYHARPLAKKSGMEMVQVAILIALAITLGLIFRTQITTFVNNTFADLNA